MASRVVMTPPTADLARLLDELAEERHRETRAALEEVTAGRVLEHAEVEAQASLTARTSPSGCRVPSRTRP